MFLEILKAILIGIVQGITEWLPVSSTGHMILFESFCSFAEKFMSDYFYKNLFLIVIQLGSILAVVVLFFGKLNPFSPKKSPDQKKGTWVLWSKVLVSALPAAVVGLLLDDWLEAHVFVDSVVSYVIAATLLIYGVLFIVIERAKNKSKNLPKVQDVADISYKTAFFIGMFQVLSLIPGTSRSGSTIIGAMLLGVSRGAAAEFSFFLALPVMLGASGLKTVKYLANGAVATTNELILLAVAFVVSFIVSLVAIRFLMEFVRRHSFEAFGWYRIILAIVVFLWVLL